MAVAATEHNSEGQGKVKDFFARMRSFYADIRSEMKKVTAPSWKEVRGTTMVVLVTVAIFGAFFWVVDLGLTQLMNWVFVHFSA